MGELSQNVFGKLTQPLPHPPHPVYGISLSNSRRLMESGWSGVLVEPLPWVFSKLHATYGGNPLATLVNVAIATYSGLQPFHASDLYSTIDESAAIHKQKWHWINALSVGDFFSQFGAEFNFVYGNGVQFNLANA